MRSKIRQRIERSAAGEWDLDSLGRVTDTAAPLPSPARKNHTSSSVWAVGTNSFSTDLTKMRIGSRKTGLDRGSFQAITAKRSSLASSTHLRYISLILETRKVKKIFIFSLNFASGTNSSCSRVPCGGMWKLEAVILFPSVPCHQNVALRLGEKFHFFSSFFFIKPRVPFSIVGKTLWWIWIVRDLLGHVLWRNIGWEREQRWSRRSAEFHVLAAVSATVPCPLRNLKPKSKKNDIWGTEEKYQKSRKKKNVYFSQVVATEWFCSHKQTNQSINQSISRPSNQSVHQSINRPLTDSIDRNIP